MTLFTPLAPLSEIQSAPVTVDDLMLKSNDDGIDEKLLKTFEVAWSATLQERGPLQGKHEERIITLQQEASALKQSKDVVETELKTQTAFFRSSREEMEAAFKTQIQEAVDAQRSVMSKYQTKLDDVATLNCTAHSAISWQHFMAELDRLVSAAGAADAADAAAAGAAGAAAQPIQEDASMTVNAVKPSARALFLAKSNLGCTDDKKDDALWLQSCAYSIDHILLKTHVQMMEAEIDRHERLTALHEQAGTILTELNVWELLTQQQSDSDTNRTAKSQQQQQRLEP